MELSPQALKLATLKVTILDNPYIPHTPTSLQAEFLLNEYLEAFYGGAAGGGKSDCLLMGALQYVEYPDYHALLLRKTFTDLALPGALLGRAEEWLNATPARWNDKTKTWIFPSGATLTFGFLEHEADKFRYAGAEFQYIGFDELTQFTESQYRFLFSRLRKRENSFIPIRMRGASNPGGVGHEWVKARYLTGASDILFVPAKVKDNPHIDQEDYLRSLDKLDPVTRARLIAGDWDAAVGGTKFHREWFEIVSDYPQSARRIRWWDFAATEKTKEDPDPDYTAGCLMCESHGVFYVLDLIRGRFTPQRVEEIVQRTAERDGKNVPIYIEQEPGSQGKILIDYYQRKVLKGFSVYGVKSTGNKQIRANPMSAAAEAGHLKLYIGSWIPSFLDEAELFPLGAHDDQIDAASGAFNKLAEVQKPLYGSVDPQTDTIHAKKERTYGILG